jgi:ADP-ribose pyrophosphatase YjhB (NUDIX family)
MPDNVLGIVIDAESKRVLLTVREREPFIRRFNGISGRVNDDEAPAVAMSRKADEEFAFKIPPEEWRKVAELRRADGTLHVFTCHTNAFAATPRVNGHRRVFLDGNSDWCRNPMAPHMDWIVPLCFDSTLTEPLVGGIA